MNPELDDLLRDLAAEAPPADSLARVRLRVAERLASRRRRLWFAWLSVPVTAALALAWILGPSPAPPPLPPAPVLARIAVPSVRWPRVAPATQSVPAPPPTPAQRNGTIVAKFQTDDPNVIVYWFFDSKPSGDLP
jgi:hypothetical protein